MHTTMRRLLLTTISLTLATACGQASDDLTLGSTEQAIVNGSDSDDGDNTAVFVQTRAEGLDTSNCTGTVIAPNLIATALHCITRTTIGSFSCKSDGSLGSGSSNDGRVGPLVDPAEVSIVVGPAVVGVQPIAHAARLFGSGSTQICRGDIGFILLDTELDVPVTPVRLDYGVKINDLIDIMGYGETEEVESTGRHKRTGVRIIDIGPASEDDAATTASPRTFVVNEGPCHGDSGGPAIAQDTGALVGVYSLAAGNSCTGIGTRNVYTSLNLFSSLARQAFTASGHEPIIDPAPVAPESPDIVPESGCSIGASPSGNAGHVDSTGLIAVAALGVGLVARRRR
jgi:uncharacterized protein (TIGR03382 family)